MPHVASKSSALHPQHHGIDPRGRPAPADPKQPATPFSLLVDGTQDPPPVRPKQSDDGTKPANRSAAADQTRNSDPTKAQRSAEGEAPATDGKAAEPAPQVATKSGAVPEEATVATSDGEVAKTTDATTKTAADAGPAAQPAAAVVVPIPPPAPPQTGTATADDDADKDGAGPAKAAAAGLEAEQPTAPKGKADQKAASAAAGNDDPPSTEAAPAADAGEPGKPVAAPKPNSQAHAAAAPSEQDKSDHTRVRDAAGASDVRAGNDPENLQTAGHAADGAPAGKPADGSQLLTAQHPTDRTTNAAASAAPTSNTAPAAVPLAGLAVEIAARAQGGRNRFEIRLDPPELGKIHVHLDVDKSGQVTSRLVVDRAETLDALRRDAAGLERALQDAGLKTADNGLQFTLRDQSFAGRDDGSHSGNTARMVVPDPDLAPIEAAAGYGGLLRARGGVDIRV